MNMILSILVCFAMLFSGGAALPAQPESATTWTLRNLTISSDAGNVSLNPELRLTTAIGSESARLQFDVVNDGEVLLPLAGELTGDGVRFRLGDSGNVYSVSNDALLELMDADAEDLQPLTYMTDYLNSYSALLSRSMSDAAFQQELGQIMIDLLVSACDGSAEQISVEIDGEAVPAECVYLEITPEAVLNLLDGLASCGVAEIEGMLNSYMLLLTSTMGESYDSLSDFTAELRTQLAEEGAENRISLPMDITYTTEAPGYVELQMNAELDETAAMQISLTETMNDAKTDIEMTMRVSSDDGAGSVNQMEFTMTEHVTGPLNAPEAVQLHIDASSLNDWSTEFEESDAETGESTVHSYACNNSMSFALDVNIAVEDGLEHTIAELTANQTSSYDYDGDANTDESILQVHITSDDRSEADGSVTAAVAAAIDSDGELLNISYELNRAEGAPVPAFDASNTIDLRPGSDEDQASPGMLYLTSDAIQVAGDVVDLSKDDSVIALIGLMGGDEDLVELVGEEFDLSGLLDGSDDYDDVEDYDDYEDYDSTIVYSFDEAADIYEGVLPEFTAPEGFELDMIDVTSYYLNASYISTANDRSFSLICYDYGGISDSYYAIQDGALVSVDGAVQINALDDEGSMYSADVFTSDGIWSFVFTDFTMEEMEAALTGLHI